MAILALHVFVALSTFAIIGVAAWALFKNKHRLYKRIGLVIAVAAAVETATGVMLVALNPELSVMKVGLHLAAYLGVCLLTEGALFLKAQRSATWSS